MLHIYTEVYLGDGVTYSSMTVYHRVARNHKYKEMIMREYNVKFFCLLLQRIPENPRKQAKHLNPVHY